MAAPTWQSYSPADLRRRRWLKLVRAEAAAAHDAGELYVAAAFEHVIRTLEIGQPDTWALREARPR